METAAAQEQHKEKIKILVVDDREDNLLSIEVILEKENYNIVKATSGRGALKILLQQQDFTLILMDVQMPDMNGFETASLIYQRQKLRHIPIIFITAHDYGDENIFKGYETGGVDYIYKPVNPEMLRYKVSVFAELFRTNHRLMAQEKALREANKKLENEIEERKLVQEKIIQLNRQLSDNNKQLIATNEELDRFAYVASHDLQEPLRKIRIFGDMIMGLPVTAVDVELQTYLKKIIGSSERMQHLISDLLEFSRYTNEDYGFEVTDFNAVLNDVVSDLDLKIQQKNAQISIGRLPIVWAIPTQIRQLFQNIINNSLKFSRPAVSPQIHIDCYEIGAAEVDEVRHHDKTEKYHRIVIRDNGIGFDQQFADDIFKVFKRLHSYHEFEGTGIGLSICKKIVEKHHGFIEVKSVQNEGATFLITIPENAGVQVPGKLQLQ